MRQFLKYLIVRIITLEARLLLRRARPKIIAITGSVGKTSTKDALYTAIKHQVHARKSDKSYNSEIGVPLSILGLSNGYGSITKWCKNIVDGAFAVLIKDRYPEWLVLEVGIDRPGDMSRLTTWLKPDVVVLTRLPTTPVHVEYFESPEAVVREKQKLVEALKPDGVIVYNHDDEQVRMIAEGALQKAIGYSRYSESAFMASNDRIVYESDVPMGVAFTLSHEGDSAEFRITGTLGMQDVYAYAAATATASVVGVPLQEAATALKEHVPPPGRMCILSGIKDTIIIDASYNSSPVALERSLQTLREVEGKRKIAVLADMLELGRYSADAHKKAGNAVRHSADILLTVGVRARGFAAGALEAGMSEKCILQYEKPLRAGRELQNMIQPGDIILIKGSESMRTELIVEEIMAHPEEAKKLLVRQDAFWKSKLAK